MAVSQHSDRDVCRHRPGHHVYDQNDDTHNKCDVDTVTHNKCDDDDHSQDDKHSNGDGDDGGFGSRELGDVKFLHGENITNQIAPPYK